MFRGYAVSLKSTTHNVSYIRNITLLCCNTVLHDNKQTSSTTTHFFLFTAQNQFFLTFIGFQGSDL